MIFSESIKKESYLTAKDAKEEQSLEDSLL
jgi:hypothetical protein